MLLLTIPRTIRLLTAALWALAIFGALPGGWISEDVQRIVVGGAIVGSCYIVTRHVARPAHELYEAGKVMGRRELLMEQASADRVVSLTERRRVRADLGRTGEAN